MSQSVGRALSLLDRVADGVGTLGALAAAEGVHKSTVLRLLRVLEADGFVHCVQSDGEHRYVLGPHLFRLAQQALDSFEVRVVAAPRLRALRDEIGQTVHLAVLDGTVATYVDKLEPRQAPVRMASRIVSSSTVCADSDVRRCASLSCQWRRRSKLLGAPTSIALASVAFAAWGA